MATKRELKKFIRNVCGDLAAEIILARAAFPSIDGKAVNKIVREIAALQTRTLALVSLECDLAPKSFENALEYKKYRCKYFKHAFDKLLVEFDNSIEELVKEMNAALPEDVRSAIKECIKEQ